jgi:hypothetical protein
VGAHRYRITIAGDLGAAAREAFTEFDIQRDGPDTVLAGDLDQAALHGTFNRILSLGLELVELRRADDDAS